MTNKDIDLIVEEIGFVDSYIPYTVVKDMCYIKECEIYSKLINLNRSKEYILILTELLTFTPKIYSSLSILKQVLITLNIANKTKNFRSLETASITGKYFSSEVFSNYDILIDDIDDTTRSILGIVTDEDIRNTRNIILNSKMITNKFLSTYKGDSDCDTSQTNMPTYSISNLHKKYTLGLPSFEINFSLKKLEVNIQKEFNVKDEFSLLLLLDRSSSMNSNIVNTYLELIKNESSKLISSVFKTVEISVLEPYSFTYDKGLIFSSSEELQKFNFKSIPFKSGIININAILTSIPKSITHVILISDGTDYFRKFKTSFKFSSIIINNSSIEHKESTKLNQGFYLELHNDSNC